MTPALNSPRIGIALLTALLHLALLYAFLQTRPAHRTEPAQPERAPIQWLHMPPPAPLPARPAAPAVTPPLPPPTPPRLSARPPRADAPPPEAVPLTPEGVAATPPAPAEPAPAGRPSVDEIMRAAKRDIGKIDKDLQKEFPQRGERAPLDTPQARLEKGFAAAHAAVRPAFYEAARMEEISVPGGAGPRIYKITTAVLTYCIKMLPDGRKVYLLNCPD